MSGGTPGRSIDDNCIVLTRAEIARSLFITSEALRYAIRREQKALAFFFLRANVKCIKLSGNFSVEPEIQT